MDLLADKIRTDFPILSSQMNGKPLVFLDSAASSQKPFQVIDAIEKYYKEQNANIHRGVYSLSQKATELFETTRIKIAKFIGAKCAKEIIFTKSTTESINLVTQSWGRTNIHAGDEIVLNELEHHSNFVPWQMLADERRATIKFIPLNTDSSLNLSSIQDVITSRTKIVSVSQMSNVTGTIHSLEKIIKRAKEVGALVLVDGAQGICHLPLNVKLLDVDFYVFSAHKMLGPTGVGVLYGKEEILESMPPWMGGGDMISKVTKNFTRYADLPARLEAGTPNIGGVIAFAHAIDYLENIGMEKIRKHELQLLQYALDLMNEEGGLELYGVNNLNLRGGVISFNIPGVHPHDVGSILDEEGIAIRVGHHCCQPFMDFMDLAGTCRASLYIYNNEEDIQKLILGIRKVKGVFASVINR